MRRFYFITLATIIIIGLLLGGCSNQTTTPPVQTTTATTAATTAATSKPIASTTTSATIPTKPLESTTIPATTTAGKPEGTFTFATPDWGKGNFIPWLAGVADAAVYQTVYESIGMPNSKGEATPCLAESWEYSKDFLTMTIHLRKGIQFHEGYGEMTSEDVKYSFDLIGAPDSKIGMREQWITTVSSIEAPDRYTVILHFKVPGTDLLTLMAQSEYNYSCIFSKKYIDKVGVDAAGRHPIGTGPWHFVEYKTGDYAKFEAVPDHWRVVPEFQYFILRLVPEESTRVAMLQTGQIDACLVGPTSLAKLPEAEFTIDKTWGGANSMIWLGGFIPTDDKRYVAGYQNTDPWKDVRVRKAMNLAINRDAMNKAFELGTARATSIYCLIPGEEDLTPYPYDPVQAKILLGQAGYYDGFSFRLVSAPSHPGVPMISKETEAVASYWEAIGIHTQIVPIDFMSYNTSNGLVGKTVGDCFSYRLTFSANPWARMRNYLPNQSSPPLVPEPALRSLAEKLLAEPDLAKRDPIYREFAKLNYDEYTVVPLFYVPFIMASSKKTVSPQGWTRNTNTYYFNYEYVRHANPLNTYRLFELK
jgi:peptide/nickel transport system substrate-binding protein